MISPNVRDLKPSNILIEKLEEARIKICDFGLSAALENSHMVEPTHGTAMYAAPEIGDPNQSFKVDVYSFGMM